MSHVTTASPKPPFRAPWRVGDAVVDRENDGWTTPKSGHPCPCQNCSRGPPAEKTGRGSLLNRISCSPDDPIGAETELNHPCRRGRAKHSYFNYMLYFCRHRGLFRAATAPRKLNCTFTNQNVRCTGDQFQIGPSHTRMTRDPIATLALETYTPT